MFSGIFSYKKIEIILSLFLTIEKLPEKKKEVNVIMQCKDYFHCIRMIHLTLRKKNKSTAYFLFLSSYFIAHIAFLL